MKLMILTTQIASKESISKTLEAMEFHQTMEIYLQTIWIEI